MKKKVLLGIVIILFMLGAGFVGVRFYIGGNIDRLQGLGGDPTAAANIENLIYIYDRGSGTVPGDCWCEFADRVLSKPVIWVVNPETKSLEGTILESDSRFSETKEQILRITREHLAGYTPSQFEGGGFFVTQVNTFNDGKNIYYGIYGIRDVGFESEYESLARVFDKRTKVFRQPTVHEEYAILSSAFWFDDQWIVGARLGKRHYGSWPIGEAQLRIVNQRNGDIADMVLDTPENQAVRRDISIYAGSDIILILSAIILAALIKFSPVLVIVAISIIILYFFRRKKREQGG